MFTGSAEFGTWKPKTEVASRLNGARKIKPAAITELLDTQQRVVDSMGANRSRDNFNTPFKVEQVLPMNTDLVEMPTKGFNELYPNKRIQESDGRANTGKVISSSRTETEAMGFHRAPVSVYARQAMGNRSIETGSSLVPLPDVRDVSATQEHGNNWTGVPTGSKRYDGASGSNAVRDTDTVQRRNDVFTLPERIADVRQSQRAIDPNFLLRDPEKGKEEGYLRPADGASGFRNRNVDAPSVTLKDLVDTTGLAGKHGYKSAQSSGMYKEMDVTAPMTLKARTSETTYVAPMFKNKGFGVRQHGIQDWKTLKETLHSEYYGGAKSAVNRSISHDTVVTSMVDRSLEMCKQGYHCRASRSIGGTGA
jgi:hypothetical protein